MEDVDRSKSTVREVTLWLIKKEKLTQLRQILLEKQIMLPGSGNWGIEERRDGRRWVGEKKVEMEERGKY
jgi:hypothetical protein